MSFEFSEEEPDPLQPPWLEEYANSIFNRLLWTMVKNDHMSMGVDSDGEFTFWITEDNTEKFYKEQHLYEE